MIFPVISKFDAELIIKKSSYGVDNDKNMSFLSTPGQVTPSKKYNMTKFRTQLTAYACPGYVQV